jgi:hypothetical protein
MRARRNIGLWLLGGTIVALLLLSIGLSNVQLLPGRPFFLGAPGPMDSGGGQLEASLGGYTWVQIVRIAFIAGALLLPLALILLALTPEGRRQLIAYLIMAGGLVLGYLLLRGSAQPRNVEVQPRPTVITETPVTATPPITDVYQASTPDWLVLVVSAVIALLVAGVLAGLLYAAWRRRYPPRTTLDDLVQEAQSAIDALEGGGELSDAILRCYAEMSRAVRQSRGIERQAAMTAREFEQALSAQGLPSEPVAQLTRLFEAARYGHLPASAQAEAQARSSLSAIVAAAQTSATTTRATSNTPRAVQGER